MTIEIRQLKHHNEFAEAVRLQREIWGFQDVELLPLRLFVVASKIDNGDEEVVVEFRDKRGGPVRKTLVASYAGLEHL